MLSDGSQAAVMSHLDVLSSSEENTATTLDLGTEEESFLHKASALLWAPSLHNHIFTKSS